MSDITEAINSLLGEASGPGDLRQMAEQIIFFLTGDDISVDDGWKGYWNNLGDADKKMKVAVAYDSEISAVTSGQSEVERINRIIDYLNKEA